METTKPRSSCVFLNIDYDENLQQQDFFIPSDNSANREWNFLCLWLLSANEKFISLSSFSDDYLEKVSRIRLSLPAQIPWERRDNFILKPWWGDWEDLALKKKYSNKYFLANILANANSTNNIPVYDGKSLDKDPRDWPKEYPWARWCLKPKFGFGGRGIKLFNSDQLQGSEFKGINLQNYLLMPWLNRQTDIGSYFEHGEHVFSYLNWVNERGNYHGSFKGKFLDNKLDPWVAKIIPSAPMELKKTDMTFSADSFLYFSLDDRLELYPFVELNMRKSLGRMLLNSPKLLDEFDIIGWFFLVRNNTPDGRHDFYGDQWRLIETSPEYKSKFRSFYLGLNLQDKEKSIREIEATIGTNLEDLRRRLFFEFAL